MCRRVAAGLVGLAVALTARGAAAGPIEDMTGYWTGAGTITLSGKDTERVKCVVIYRVGQGGGTIKQTMRCASADYAINAKADLTVKGTQVEGTWEEQTYSATGQVSGRYTGGSFTLSIQGANFSAAMDVGLSSCKQSIQIRPKGLEVRRISMSLSKC
jgi:hypothetical protein